MGYLIRKTSGRKEYFDLKKFRRSLKKAGASPKIINEIIKEIYAQKPKSTRQIHQIASDILTQYTPPIAARYNLKRALIELGPAGYPFELFIGQLFTALGYHVLTNQFVPGKCVDHEVDIVAQKKNKHYMIECKFHNRLGLKSDVKVILYIHARFEDIHEAWQRDILHAPHEIHQAWVVTNTRFTSQAIKYAKCRNIKLLSWSYPHKNNLAHLVDKLGLHPITALPGLTRKQKKAFIQDGFVLCKDAQKHKQILKKLGFTDHQIKKLILQAEAVCDLNI